jgi:hypothetical protein
VPDLTMRKNATVIPTTQEAAMSINEVRSNDAITDARVKIYASRRGVGTVLGTVLGTV